MKKTYAQKITQAKRKELLALIDKAIDFHERFRNAYCFTPPSLASERRSYEQYNQRDIKFLYDGIEYRFRGYTSCSCKNVYYYGTFYENGEKKTVRAFKKIGNELIAAIVAYESKHSNGHSLVKESEKQQDEEIFL